MGCGHKAPYYDKYHWYNTGYNPAGKMRPEYINW